MIDLEEIGSCVMPRPEGETIFGSAQEFDSLPAATRDQISFLNREATDYLIFLAQGSRLITGGAWDPFAEKNYKTIEVFEDFRNTDESLQHLNKWLYQRALPFSGRVFLLQDNDPAVFCTWKMIIRCASLIFPFGDVAVFDRTLNWCLFYYHGDRMFFGRDRTYDPSKGEKMMEELNERKRRFPSFRHPYL